MEIILKVFAFLFVMVWSAGVYAHRRDQSGDAEAFDRRTRHRFDLEIADFRRHPSAALVLASVLAFFFLAGFVSIDAVSKPTARWLFVGLMAVCALSSMRLVQTTWPLLARNLQNPGFILKSLFLMVVFAITTLAQAFSESRIQEIVGESPGDFSSAGFALTGAYAFWLWLHIAAGVLLLIGTTVVAHFLLAPLRVPIKRFVFPKAVVYHRVEHSPIASPVAFLGLFVPAVAILSLLVSPWWKIGFQTTTRDLFLLLSFSDSANMHRQCSTKPGQAVRIIDDGDRVLIHSNGKLLHRKCSEPQTKPTEKPLMR
jgi:hypothetical protein